MNWNFQVATTLIWYTRFVRQYQSNVVWYFTVRLEVMQNIYSNVGIGFTDHKELQVFFFFLFVRNVGRFIPWAEIEVSKFHAIGGSKEGNRGVYPPPQPPTPGPFFFNFMQFLGKMAKITGSYTHRCRSSPVWEILDSPPYANGIMSSEQTF